MRTWMALLAMAAAAAAQEPPSQDEERERARAHIQELEKRAATLREQVQALTPGQNLHAEKVAQLRQVEAELARRRPQESPERLRARLEDWNKRLQVKPDDAEALLQRSDIRRRLGDIAGAEEDFRQAARLDPNLARRVPRPPEPSVAERRPGEGEGIRRDFNEEEVRKYLRENEPETQRHLEILQRQGRREDAVRVMAEAHRRMRELAEMKERRPEDHRRLLELRQTERESLELAEKARAAEGPEREKLAEKLTEVLEKLFDLREESRARELEELKRRVADIEKALQDRKAARREHVEDRRRQLLEERPPRDD